MKLTGESFCGSFETEESHIVDGSVDLILTDPPYNISQELHCLDWEGNTISPMQFDANSEHKWDSVDGTKFVDQLAEWSKLFAKKLRKNGHFVVFMSDQFVSQLWDCLELAGLSPKRLITVRKPSAVPFNRKSRIISSCEYAIYGLKETGGKGTQKATFNSSPYFGQDNDLLYGWSVADKAASIVYKRIRERMMQANSFEKVLMPQVIAEELRDAGPEITQAVSKMRKDVDYCYQLNIPNQLTLSFPTAHKSHPNEKPVELLKYFVALLSKEGDTILDPFAGSGSTAEASYILRRSFILVEQERKYCDVIKTRLSKYEKDPNLVLRLR